jgi:putative transposase
MLIAPLSTGVTFNNPKAYRKTKKQLARLQRQLQRKEKGSQKRERCKRRLAKTYQRVANVRKDTIHKMTHYLCKNHAVIGIEDLNVSGMMANHKLLACCC